MSIPIKNLIIDSTPLIFEGGISNYVKPLAENLIKNADSTWQVELLFRLSLDRSRFRLYRKYLENACSYANHNISTYLPDSIIEMIWKHGSYLPATLFKNKSNSIFIATTEMVPSRGRYKIGWIIYDLTLLRIQKYFDINIGEYQKKIKCLAKKTDFIITISNNSKNDIIELLSYPEERIFLIYPGVTEINSKPMDGIIEYVKRPYVYYLGSLALNKNVDGMLRIFSKCVNHYGLNLDIVLTGKDFCGSAYWNQLSKEYNIEGRVHITGWINDDEREYYLTHALMLWQFSWYEGFGLPVLEAASRGIPVLYSNRGALPEILNNPEQEIDPDNEQGAAYKAVQALQSPGTLSKWRELGLRRSRDFSWDVSAQLLIRCLEELS